MGAMTNNGRKLANFAGFYKYVTLTETLRLFS